MKCSKPNGTQHPARRMTFPASSSAATHDLGTSRTRQDPDHQSLKSPSHGRSRKGDPDASRASRGLSHRGSAHVEVRGGERAARGAAQSPESTFQVQLYENSTDRAPAPNARAFP